MLDISLYGHMTIKRKALWFSSWWFHVLSACCVVGLTTGLKNIGLRRFYNAPLRCTSRFHAAKGTQQSIKKPPTAKTISAPKVRKISATPPPEPDYPTPNTSYWTTLLQPSTTPISQRVDYVINMPSAPNNEIVESSNTHHKMLWKAAVSACHPIMAASKDFPISYYIVQQYERYQKAMLRDLNVSKIDSTGEWKCVAGTVRFLDLTFKPILYMNAHIFPSEERVEFNITRSEIEIGSHFQQFNQTFAIRGSNIISSGIDKVGFPTIQSCLNLEVETLLPVIKIPRNLLQGFGTHLLQRAVNSFVPYIINSLAVDYLQWCSEQHKAVEKEQMDN